MLTAVAAWTLLSAEHKEHRIHPVSIASSVSVGRALTRWEEFEVVFASLFSALVAAEDNNAAAIRAYGSVITFRGSAEMVKSAAEVNFSLFRNSALEKDFRAFVNELTNHASARRNEIAHGVVRVTPIIKDYTVVSQYFLYPPYYASNKLQLIGSIQMTADKWLGTSPSISIRQSRLINSLRRL